MGDTAGGQQMSDSALKQLQEDLGTQFEGIQGRINKLNKLIDNLEGSWHGIGRGAFDNVQRGVNSDMRVLQQLLNGFVEAIGDTRKLSAGNEDDIVQGMKKLQSSGGGESKLQHL